MKQNNLKQFLSSLTKKDLTEIRQYWQFGGISQLNKAELIEALDERIKLNLKDCLNYQLSRNIEFIEKVIAEQKSNNRVEVNFRDILPPTLYNFYYRGIIDLKDNEEESSVRIPADLVKEIKEIISEPEFKEQIKENEEIMTFVRGLLVYYGALSGSQIYDFYEKYYNNKEKHILIFIY